MDNGYLSVWLNQTGFNFTDADRLISADYLGDIDGNGNGRYDPFVGYFGFTGGTGGLNDQFIVDDLYIKMVPEPGTLALLGLGALGVIRRRGRK
jgi:hypothetical protein